jgi:SAM-dependent methyltransferase
MKQHIKIAIGLLCDIVLGIETHIICAKPNDHSFCKDSYAYEPTNYITLYKMRGLLDLSAKDIFVDIGCGKGRVICFMALQRMNKVVGVEIDRELYRTAVTNYKRLRFKITPVEIINADAFDTTINNGTIYFMFNPFGDKTLLGILNNIKESTLNNPRHVRILCDHAGNMDVINQQPWLQAKGEIGKTCIFHWEHIPCTQQFN